jgi:hypothetical protein
MVESNVWGARRFLTLLAVLALHAGFLALLIMTSGRQNFAAPANQAVELMFLPPPKVPKVRIENAPLQHRLTTNAAISVTLPGLNAPSLSPPTSGADGEASTVDWAAEAHRAVQAFEIRRDHPSRNALSSAWNGALPGEHHACDLFKTDSGDWIVWISASCYQIARSGASGVFAPSSAQSQTICPRRLDMPRGNLVSQLPACKKLISQD